MRKDIAIAIDPRVSLSGRAVSSVRLPFDVETTVSTIMILIEALGRGTKRKQCFIYKSSTPLTKGIKCGQCYFDRPKTKPLIGKMSRIMYSPLL